MTHPSFDDVHRSVTVPAPLSRTRWEESTAAPPGRPDRRGAWPEWHMGFVVARDGRPFGEVKVFDDGRVFVVAPSSATGGDVTVSAAFPVGH